MARRMAWESVVTAVPAGVRELTLLSALLGAEGRKAQCSPQLF